MDVGINDGVKIKLLPFQEKFILSEARNIAIISSIATGKTMTGIFKLMLFCEKFPDSLALLLRKSQTDAMGSTLRDFQKYFKVSFNSRGEFTLPNGSAIIARHAAEIDSIKNYNINFILIEQGEELDGETYHFLRDRLRRKSSPYQQICVLSNAAGENYLKKMFINNAEKINVLDEETGQREYISEGGDFYCLTANTFANAANLDEKFLKDLKMIEKHSPNHFRQMIMNDLSGTIRDDALFSYAELDASRKNDYPQRPGYGYRILACDPARFGSDKTAVVIIQQMGALHWEQIHVEQWQGHDAIYTVGRVNEIAAKFNADSIIIDEDGLGGPIGDFLRGQNQRGIVGFRNIPYSAEKNEFYGNARTAAAFKVKEMVSKGWLKLNDEKIIQELAGAFFFKYTIQGQRILISKDKLKSDGIDSPNAGDALCYAVSLCDEVREQDEMKYEPRPRDNRGDDLFKIAGVM